MIAPRRDAQATAPTAPPSGTSSTSARASARPVAYAPGAHLALPGPTAWVVRHRIALRVAGIACLVVGLLLGARTAFEMWGSDVYQANAQAQLAEDLARQESPGLAWDEPPDASVPDGAVARIRIPAVGLDAVVVAGTDVDALRQGPGWMTKTVMPGQPGNAVISGHRSTYGAPFREIDELVAGDQIIVSIPNQPDAVYEVRGTEVVTPSDVWVADPTGGVRLTLTTCHPEGSNRQRLIVQAELVAGTHAAEALSRDQWTFSVPA